MSDKARSIEISDEVIVEGIKNGEDRASTALWDKYNTYLYKCCKYYYWYFSGVNAQHEDVLEIVNEGIYKAILNIEKYDKSKGAIKTWIRAIVKNMTVDFLRKKFTKGRKSLRDKFLDKVLGAEFKEHHNSKNKDKLSKSDILDKILKSLTVREKDVMQLVFRGNSYEDICSYLGITYGNAKTVYSRTISKAQKIYIDNTKNLKGT